MNYTYKQIWLINLPVMMSVLMEQLINITDAVFLGHVGEVELGDVSVAGIYYLATYMLGFGFSIGLQVMSARRNGEQNYAETGRTFFQGTTGRHQHECIITRQQILYDCFLISFKCIEPEVFLQLVYQINLLPCHDSLGCCLLS